jgi:phosphotriesterase-related protein
MSGNYIETVKGSVPVAALGLILPHEHLFTDLRRPTHPNYAQGDPEQVAQMLRPHLEAAEKAGVTALVECTGGGVGRNIAVLRRLAEITPIHIVAPTGVYKEGFIPADMLDLSAEALADRWVRDLVEGIDGTSSRAGFIKVAISDDGPTPIEVRNLQAAALASRQTGAVIASHTIGGAGAKREVDVLEKAGHDLSRFVWVHAQTEPDSVIHQELARRGVWIELDTIGVPSQHEPQLRAALALIEAGMADNLLLSHDAGWYDPSQPDGVPAHGFRGYTALVEEFIPALRARGVTDAMIHQLTVTNPARAFAIAKP